MKHYYVTQNGEQVGPFAEGHIEEKINAGELSSNDLCWTDGMDEWRPISEIIPLQSNTPPLPNVGSDEVGGDATREHSDEGHRFVQGVVNKITDASGLDRLEGFSVKSLFSEVFKKHSPDEIEEHFASGTRTTTPSFETVSAVWPAPWAFFRVLSLSIFISVIFYWAINRFENPMLIPGWIFVGCFGIPFSVLVFFLESNVLRNASTYRVLNLLLTGGMLSLVISLFLFDLTYFDDWVGPMSAGLIEELGKLMAVVYFTRKWKGFHWILNGILFGAAVGAGFSAFESAGYVFVNLGSSQSYAAESTMTLRAFLSPFTHVIWTAIAAGALWRVKQNKQFEFSMLMDWKFLRVFLIVVALHAMWNSPLTIPFVGGMSGYMALRITFGVIGWLLVLLLMQAGMKEIQVDQAAQLAGGSDIDKSNFHDTPK